MLRDVNVALRVLIVLLALAVSGVASAATQADPPPEDTTPRVKRSKKKVKRVPKPDPEEEDEDEADEEAAEEEDFDESGDDPDDAMADVRAVIRSAFKAAMDHSEGIGFNKYLDLIHEEQKHTGHAVDQIRRYSWKKFRGGAYQWLKSSSKLDFVIARTDPSKLGKDDTKVRVFFKAQHKPKGGGPKRYDAPIELRKSGSRWMIWRNSL